MTHFILNVYEYLRTHRVLCWLSLAAVTLLLAAGVAGLEYEEDIADFLPVGRQHHDALKVYRDVSGSGKVFAVVGCRDTAQADPDLLVAGADDFAAAVARADTGRTVANLMAEADMERMASVAAFVYANMPYFLTEADYRRMDSLLAQPGYAAAQLARDKQLLMFPTGGLLAGNLEYDPLNLFGPVAQRLQRADSGLAYELYDGHIFSPDMRRAIVMMDSPYGASETEHNARLCDLLRACADSVEARHAGLDIHIVGGPVIAVGNATQIKHDSVLAVVVSATLILALLLFSLRNLRNLLLIVVSIAWGWLFAMGGLALLHDRVSVIVIGISSVIIGIAVNYPLHFIAHLSHTPHRRKALREIVMPLLVGNVTTVGAFLALVPLQSTALRDLGLFSSLLLVGTIVFVLLYLPHLAHLSRTAPTPRHTWLDRLSGVSLENKPRFVAAVLVLTAVLGYFSFQTRFDADITHINYMTDEQQADMAYFQRTMMHEATGQKVYAIATDSTMDGALRRMLRLQPCLDSLAGSGSVSREEGVYPFLAPRDEQARRLRRWQQFVASHEDALGPGLRDAMRAEGFAPESFGGFFALTAGHFRPQPLHYFAPLTQTLFATNISTDSAERRYSIVSQLTVDDGHVDRVEKAVAAHGGYGFDVGGMNRAVANRLSADFNYIGFACGFIVFFFLWLSMGSIELAVLSFVPMAVSWLWILGIMALTGMQFNIVNIILATFIFGQGDDYTIFMTEGACYEYAYRRRMLASYKHSIILSALIMFIGIGTLIVARHPALHSLAEVTIAGMFSVVLTAYVFPPLIFRFLVRGRHGFRRRPLSLVPLLASAWAGCLWAVQTAAVAVYGFGLRFVRRSAADRQKALRHRVHRRCRRVLTHLPTVAYDDGGPLRFASPVLVDGRCLAAWPERVCAAISPQMVTVSASASYRPGRTGRWMGHVALDTDPEAALAELRRRVAEGCCPVALDDEALAAARTLHLPVVTLVALGFDNVWPDGGHVLHGGRIAVGMLQGEASAADGDAWAAPLRTARSLHGLVVDRYRYKGTEVVRTVARRLRRYADYAQWIDTQTAYRQVTVVNGGYGEFALLYALVHPQTAVTAVEPDDERAALLRYSAEGVAPNLRVVADGDAHDGRTAPDKVFDVEAIVANRTD